MFIPGLVASLLDPFGGRRIVRSLNLFCSNRMRWICGEKSLWRYPWWTPTDHIFDSCIFPVSVRSGCLPRASVPLCLTLKRGGDSFCLSGNLRPISVRLRFYLMSKWHLRFLPFGGEENRLVHRSALHRDDLDLCWGFLTPCAYPCLVICQADRYCTGLSVHWFRAIGSFSQCNKAPPIIPSGEENCGF